MADPQTPKIPVVTKPHSVIRYEALVFAFDLLRARRGTKEINRTAAQMVADAKVFETYLLTEPSLEDMRKKPGER